VYESFDAQLQVRSVGSQAIPSALIHVASTPGIVLESVTPSEGTCQPQQDYLLCDLGTMDFGTSRTIQIRAHGEHLLDSGYIYASAGLDVVDSYEVARGVVRVDVRRSVDVGFASNWSQFAGLDGQEFLANVNVESTGISPAENVVVTLPLPDSVTIRRVWMNSTDCQIAGQTATCNLGTLAPDANVRINLRLLAPEPVSVSATATLSSSADEDSSDNSTILSLVINPNVQFDLIPPATPARAVVDSAFEVTYAVATNRHTPTGASFELTVNDNTVVESAQPGTGSCEIAANGSVKCQLDPLPANSTTPIVIRLRPVRPGTIYISARLRTVPSVSTTGNFSHYMNLTAEREGDAAVSFVEQAVSGMVGQTSLGFTVRVEVLETIGDGQLSIEVDASRVSVRNFNLRGPGFCSKLAGSVSCYLSSLETGKRDLIDVYLDTVSAGESSATIRLTSTGDANPVNNVSSIPVTLTDPPPLPPIPATPVTPVTPPVTPPPSGGGNSGSGGGGGAMDLLLATLSTLLLCHRARRQITRRR
jgi:hypothetical protein